MFCCVTYGVDVVDAIRFFINAVFRSSRNIIVVRAIEAIRIRAPQVGPSIAHDSIAPPMIAINPVTPATPKLEEKIKNLNQSSIMPVKTVKNTIIAQYQVNCG